MTIFTLITQSVIRITYRSNLITSHNLIYEKDIYDPIDLESVSHEMITPRVEAKGVCLYTFEARQLLMCLPNWIIH